MATLLAMGSSRSHIHPVSSSGEIGTGEAGSSTPPDPGPFLAALREAADHESSKEERVEQKTRGIVTISGAYFAIVQTVAFSSAAVVGKLEGDGRTWTIALAVAAIAALAWGVAAAIRQQWPREHQSLPSEKIGQDLLALLYGSGDNREAVKKLAEHYAGVTNSRITANRARVHMYYVCAAACLSAVGLTTTELVVALLTRTP